MWSGEKMGFQVRDLFPIPGALLCHLVKDNLSGLIPTPEMHPPIGAEITCAFQVPGPVLTEVKLNTWSS